MTTEESELPSADERIAAMPEPPTSAVQQLKRRDASKTILLLFASMGMALGMIGAAVALGSRDEAKQDANQALSSVAQVQQQVAANVSALDEANRRLIALGKTPVPVPKVDPPVAQPAGLSALQSAAVRVIVSDQISRQKVTVTQAEVSQIARIAALMIPKPADGKTPTAAQIKPQVTAAIAAYCTADKCVGKPGTDGKPGADGANGAPGADAPKVTDAELLAAAQQALAAYCATDGKPCDGKVGPDGPQGPAGADAPVITDFDCVGNGSDSYWRIQFDKGPDKTALGPCRVTVIDPPPTTSADR
jgi:hypothetical protein